MIKLLVFLAVRGGLKVGPILLSVSLFTGLVVVLNVVSHSYAAQTPILRQLGEAPSLFFLRAPVKGSLMVKITALRLNDFQGLALSPERIDTFLKIIHATYEGSVPSDGEALVGEDLRLLISSGRLSLNNSSLSVAGIIKEPRHTSSMIVMTQNTFAKVAGETYAVAYLAEEALGSSVSEAPALRILVKGIIDEALFSISSLTYLLYLLLALASSVQAYTAMQEAKSIFQVFSALGASRRKTVLALGLLSMVLAASCAILGSAIGILSSAVISSSASLFVKLPHLELVFGPELFYVVSMTFGIASASLTAGLAKGYLSSL